MSKSLNAKLEDFYPRSPCGERPGCQRPCERPTRDFYPRSPCGERRPHGQKHIYSRAFLSTLSLRRATSTSDKLFMPSHYFYPRSPCGERRNESSEDADNGNFYPRSPCGERLDKRCQFNGDNGFLSTLSLRRATMDTLILANAVLFLSTLSLRRATQAKALKIAAHGISIHALLAESDRRRTHTPNDC